MQAQRMVAFARKDWILGLCLVQALLLAGCAAPTKSSIAKSPLTAEQQQWWTENRPRARYVKGKGYYVEGTSGFFDHNGHRVQTELEGVVEDEGGGILDRLAPKHLWAKTKKAVGQGPNESIARQYLAEADALFRQKKYVDAAELYRKAYKRWPDSPLEEEAIYKAGESEFFADRYVAAEDEYSLLVKKFNSSQYLTQVTERRFAIGRYWEAFDRKHPKFILTPNLTNKTIPRFDTGGHALRVYERIRLDDPIGPRADDAVMATANAYFLKGRWDDADYHYGLLRSEFPKSEHQYQAHLLGLRCKILRYQGPAYEGTQLDEAEDLATQLLTQFPSELGTERERIVQARTDLRNQRALREWERAEFYAKNDYYGAARHHYAKVIDNFSDTRLAEQSRDRVEQYADMPANPDPPFEWLVELLPASKKEGPSIAQSSSPRLSQMGNGVPSPDDLK